MSDDLPIPNPKAKDPNESCTHTVKFNVSLYRNDIFHEEQMSYHLIGYATMCPVPELGDNVTIGAERFTVLASRATDETTALVLEPFND